ncbi:hypothetical protein ADEAN_000707000 [Angomonas deanei]|uniref:Uncharacterized protein n=1 Tax=Angomonas deanei TaxID=59799 RepID=A0A7G2CKU4_9TRYP|nr:hypothetical protein ADEAN_000707000 [Angomonas deanei]
MQSSKSSVAPLSTGTLNDASHITLTNLVLSPISQGKMEANFGELVSFQTVASTAANVQNNNTSSNGNDVSSVVNPVFIGFPALFASHRLKSESHIPNQENKSSQLNKERRPSTSGREEAARPSYTNRRASVDKSKKKENKNDKNDNSEGQTEQMLLHQHSSDAFYNNRRKRSLSCNDLLAVHTAAHNFSQKGNHNPNEEDNSGSSNSNPNNNNNNKIVASSFSGSLYSFSSSAANPNNNNNNPHFSDVNTLRQNFVFSDLQHFQMKSNSDSNSTQGSGAAGYRPQREDDEEQVRTSDTVEGGTLRIQPSAAPPLVSSPIFKPVRKDESLNSAVHHNSNGNNIDYDNRLASLDENWFRRRTMRPEDISENKKKSSSNESNNTTNKSENYDAIFQSIKTDTLYSAVRTSDQHNNSGSHQHAIKDEADNDVMVLESDAEEENPKDNNNNNNNVKVVKKTRSRRKSVVSIVERHVGDTNENNTNKATEKNNNNNGHNKSHNNSVNTSKEEEGMLSLRSSQIFKSILQSTNNNNNNIHPPNNNNNNRPLRR